MPSYSYKCQKCGHQFDGTAKMTDPCPPCPVQSLKSESWPGRAGQVWATSTCGGATEKVITAGAAVHFTGGGWAKDGYSKGRT